MASVSFFERVTFFQTIDPKNIWAVLNFSMPVSGLSAGDLLLIGPSGASVPAEVKIVDNNDKSLTICIIPFSNKAKEDDAYSNMLLEMQKGKIDLCLRANLVDESGAWVVESPKFVQEFSPDSSKLAGNIPKSI